jgi:hypothetical protein
MASITVWRILGLFALAEPHFLLFFESDFQTLVRHAFDLLVASVAEGLLFTQTAGAPGDGFTCFYLYTTGFILSCDGKSFILYKLNASLLSASLIAARRSSFCRSFIRFFRMR